MRTISCAAAVWLTTAFLTEVHAQNWPQFRGPAGDGVAADAALPAEWAADRNIAWKVAVTGTGWSQPVVWGDKLFVTTAVSDQQTRPRADDWSPGGTLGGLSILFSGGGKPPDIDYRWDVLCLNVRSGEVLWRKTAREGKPTIRTHANNSYATETPATDGERLIAYFGMAGVYGYDLAGELLWSKDLGTYPMQFGWGTGSSPVLFDNAVYIQCDNDQQSFLVALNNTTGDELWRVSRDERSNWSTPYLWKKKQRTELVAAGGTKMRAYDPATGTLLWEIAGDGRTATTPVGDEELLYVDSYDRLTGNRGFLIAVRAGASGEITRSEGQSADGPVAWSVQLTSTRVASPLLCDGCLYVLNQMQGIIHCLDAKTGKQHYRQRLPDAAGFTASPWSAGGKVFCLDQDGRTFVLAPGPELKVLAVHQLSREMFWSSPALAASALILRSADHLYCIREQ